MLEQVNLVTYKLQLRATTEFTLPFMYHSSKPFTHLCLLPPQSLENGPIYAVKEILDSWCHRGHLID